MKDSLGHAPIKLLLLPDQAIRFGGELWFHNGRATDKQQRLLFRNREGLSRDWTDRELLRLQSNGELRFLTAVERDRLGKADIGAPPREVLDTCDAGDKKIVDWKRHYVRAWEAAGRPSRTPAGLAPVIATAARELGNHAPPSVRMFQRHINASVNSGGDPEMFVPQHSSKGNREPRKTAEFYDLVKDWVDLHYLVEPRPTLSVVFAAVKREREAHNKPLPAADHLPEVGRSMVYEIMRSTDRYTETFVHRGKREADHKFRMVEDGPASERHNECWEIDHTTVDLIVIDQGTGLPVGRPFITMVIDRHTRMIAGYHVGWDFPGIQPTLECLRCAISIKDAVLAKVPGLRNPWPAFGKPGLLVPDNAKHFSSKAFKEACRNLGIDVARPPPLKAWYKGKIERAFRTYATGLCHLVPGTTFSSVYQRLKEKPPEKVAMCTLAEFDAMLVRFIVDIYNVRRNRVLNNSPLLAYEASVQKHKQKLPPNPADLNSSLSVPYYRKVQREGILFMGLWYRGPELLELLVSKSLSRIVLIKVDPKDLTRIWFIHPVTHAAVELKIAKSQRERVRGIDLETHLLAQSMQRNNPDLLAGEAGIAEAYGMIEMMYKERANGDGLANRRIAAKHLDRLRKRAEAYVIEEAAEEGNGDPEEEVDVSDEVFAEQLPVAAALVDEASPLPVATPAVEAPQLVEPPTPTEAPAPSTVETGTAEGAPGTAPAAAASAAKKRGRPKGSGNKKAAPALAVQQAAAPTVPTLDLGDEDLDLDALVSGKTTVQENGDGT